jgi:hypothetical protein
MSSSPLSSRVAKREGRLNEQGGRDFIIDLVHLLFFPNLGHLALVWTDPVCRPLEALDTFQVGLYTLDYRTTDRSTRAELMAVRR